MCMRAFFVASLGVTTKQFLVLPLLEEKEDRRGFLQASVEQQAISATLLTNMSAPKTV